jgi:hypothetical protein
MEDKNSENEPHGGMKIVARFFATHLLPLVPTLPYLLAFSPMQIGPHPS